MEATLIAHCSNNIKQYPGLAMNIIMENYFYAQWLHFSFSTYDFNFHNISILFSIFPLSACFVLHLPLWHNYTHAIPHLFWTLYSHLHILDAFLYIHVCLFKCFVFTRTYILKRPE